MIQWLRTNLANRLILGRWAVSLETKNEKLTGLVFCRLSNQVTAKKEKNDVTATSF